MLQFTMAYTYLRIYFSLNSECIFLENGVSYLQASLVFIQEIWTEIPMR